MCMSACGSVSFIGVVELFCASSQSEMTHIIVEYALTSIGKNSEDSHAVLPIPLE